MYIDDKILTLYDGLPNDEQKELIELVRKSKFNRSVYSSSIKENFGFFHYGANPTEEELEKYTFYQRVRKSISRDNYYFVNSLINAQAFGDQTFIHQDMEEYGLTFLFYIIDYEWNPDFGGETVFYNDKKEIVHTVIPRRDRYMLADSRILHVGRCPNRLFIGDRFTLSIRFRLKDGKR